MVKQITAIAVLFGIMGLTQSKAAQSYVSVHGGLGFIQDADVSEGGLSGEFSFDPGMALDIAVGVTPSEGTPVRAEAAFIFQKNDIDEVSVDGLGSAPLDGDATVIAGLINLYYDFENDSPVTPFITGGVGLANVDAEIEGDSEDDSVIAYQLGGGIGYALSETTTLDLMYRYFSMQDPEFDGADVEVAAHQFLIGARFAF